MGDAVRGGRVSAVRPELVEGSAGASTGSARTVGASGSGRTLVGIFISSLLLGFSGALMPGPVFAAVVAGAASSGFWFGPAVVLGHGVLELATVLVLVRGLGAVLARPA